MNAGFKAQVTVDVATFLEPTEFGELRSLDGGVPVQSVREDHHLDEREVIDGVYIETSTLYVRRSDLALGLPQITQRLDVDGKIARVVGVTIDMGVAAIRLAWLDS